MPAYPDVPEALRACATAASSSRVLTSRPPRRPRRCCNAGIRERFELVLSAPASGAFKPEDLAYKSALEHAGMTEAWFVAGHWWDVAGAAFAGLRTAWISRTDLAYPVAMPEPDVRGADLASGGTADYSRRLHGACPPFAATARRPSPLGHQEGAGRPRCLLRPGRQGCAWRRTAA